MTALVKLKDVTLGYGRRPAAHHVDGEVHAGDLIAVVGPNGAGKTTLLKGLARLMKPLDGRIAHFGLKRGDIAYLHLQDLRVGGAAERVVGVEHLIDA